MRRIRGDQVPCNNTRATSAILLGVVLVASVMNLSGGAASEGPVAQETIEFSSPLHVAWRVWIPEDPDLLRIRIEGSGESDIVGRGLWIWKAGEREETRRGAWGYATWGHSGAFFQSEVTGPAVTDLDLYPPCEQLPEPVPCGGGGFGSETGWRLDGPAEWIVLVEAAPDGPFQGFINLSLPAGAAILGLTSGTATLDVEDQFRGTLNVRVNGPSVIELKVMEKVSIPRDLEDGYFGLFFGRSDSDELRMGYDGPAGSEDGQRLYLFEDAEAGTYSLRVDHDVETDWASRIVVVGANVVLP